jgi:hypothetical protein
VLVAAGPDASTEPRIDAGDAGVTSSPADKKSGISPIAENDEEEEILLKHAEPEDGDRVLDADEGVPPHAKSRAGKVSAPLAEPVSVRVESNPQGAVVSLGKRVFGRAPINLRFRPGITFELKFVKKGYLPKTKHFAVTAGQKKQTIRVGLKKRSEPKKSLFRRIFG